MSYKFRKLLQEYLHATYVITGIYIVVVMFFQFINLAELIELKSKENICLEWKTKDRLFVENLKIWDSIIIFDLFVPDMVNEFNNLQCNK